MRVGVYIDGFNLYYGIRRLMKSQRIGWKWLDVRGLVAESIRKNSEWEISELNIVYFTARQPDHFARGRSERQDRYLRALEISGSVNEIVFGKFVSRLTDYPLAGGTPRAPSIYRPDWPIRVKRDDGVKLEDAWFLARVMRSEEKGTDVNLASRLLIDYFTQRIDAAVVVSNDSDLEMAVKYVRNEIPLGVLGAGVRPTAGPLQMDRNCSMGSWVARIAPKGLSELQLPREILGVEKPKGW